MPTQRTPTCNLEYLSEPENKRKLNALLHVYRVYKNIVCNYLNEPTNPLNEDLNIFYIRDLIPAIQKLAKELLLEPDVAVAGIKLPTNFIIFPNLFGSEKILQNLGKDSEYARVEVFDIYGKIKQLVEKVKAVGQEPILDMEKLVTKSIELMTIPQEEQIELSPRDIPHFSLVNGWWRNTLKKKVALFKAKTLRGEWLGVMTGGDAHGKDSVCETLREKTGEEPNETQITNAMKDINKKFKEEKLPPLKLLNHRGSHSWQLLFKKNHR